MLLPILDDYPVPAYGLYTHAMIRIVSPITRYHQTQVFPPVFAQGGVRPKRSCIWSQLLSATSMIHRSQTTNKTAVVHLWGATKFNKQQHSTKGRLLVTPNSSMLPQQ